MRPLTNTERDVVKSKFRTAIKTFVAGLNNYISDDSGQWTVKGFIDIYKNIYTISFDTKIVSKILEIHLLPKILQFADTNGFSIVLAEHQNWYPDLSFVSTVDPRIKFAVDLKTTYRDPQYPAHVNGFTLGSHGAYFKDRTSKKNVQFSYAEYCGHFCLGIIYTRADNGLTVKTIENLRSITSVVKDFLFFACEKWEIAGDRQGSGNTANIGSITFIEDILKGNGIFANLGEQWFDEYWMNYKVTKMMKNRKVTPITCLNDFIKFKHGNVKLINKIVSKTKITKDPLFVTTITRTTNENYHTTPEKSGD